MPNIKEQKKYYQYVKENWMYLKGVMMNEKAYYCCNNYNSRTACTQNFMGSN